MMNFQQQGIASLPQSGMTTPAVQPQQPRPMMPGVQPGQPTSAMQPMPMSMNPPQGMMQPGIQPNIVQQPNPYAQPGMMQPQPGFQAPRPMMPGVQPRPMMPGVQPRPQQGIGGLWQNRPALLGNPMMRRF